MPSLKYLLLALPLALALPGQGNGKSKDKTTTVTKTVTKTVTGSAVTVTRTTSIIATCTGSPTSSVSVTRSTSATSSTTAGSSPTSSAPNTQEYPTSTELSTATGTLGLNDYAQATGLSYFGTAADIPGPEQQDQLYLAQLNNTHDFGQLTSTNYLKWFTTEPQRGVFNFTGAYELIDIARANNQKYRCHNLVWHNQLPDWLTSQTYDNATLVSILQNHIKNLVTTLGETCYHWDVVNEAFEDDGTYRNSTWLQIIGPEYLSIAFRTAAQYASPLTKLYYNDYNIEYPGPKSTAAQNLVRQLKANGIRIDGVGLQSHFVVGGTPSLEAQQSNHQAFAALGVETALTELDVRAPTLPATTAQQVQQKTDYKNSVRACVNVKGCVGVTLWDFVDQYSWIPGTFPGQGYASPWFKANTTKGELVRKNAYDGILEALRGL